MLCLQKVLWCGMYLHNRRYHDHPNLRHKSWFLRRRYFQTQAPPAAHYNINMDFMYVYHRFQNNFNYN